MHSDIPKNTRLQALYKQREQLKADKIPALYAISLGSTPFNKEHGGPEVWAQRTMPTKQRDAALAKIDKKIAAINAAIERLQNEP